LGRFVGMANTFMSWKLDPRLNDAAFITLCPPCEFSSIEDEEGV